MNFAFFFATTLFAVALVVLLFWALRGANKRADAKDGLGVIEDAPRHISNMTQIRRALDDADLQFAAAKGGTALAARLRRERRRVALLYLESIHQDFEKLLRIARIVAVLSPEVSSSHEYHRLRLSIIFRWRFQVAKLRLMMGSFILPQTDVLGQMVATLAAQMEVAMTNLGERAALAVELAAQSDQ